MSALGASICAIFFDEGGIHADAQPGFYKKKIILLWRHLARVI